MSLPSSPPSFTSLLVPGAHFWMVLAWLTVMLAQSVAPALPGSIEGIGSVVDVTLLVGAHLTQLSSVLFLLLAARMAQVLFTRRYAVTITIPLTMVSIGTAVTIVLSTSGYFALHPKWLGSMGLAVSAILGLVAWYGFRYPASRTTAPALFSLAVAGFLHTVSKVLAVSMGDAASELGYALSRSLSTSAWLAELCALGLASLIALRSSRIARVQLPAAGALAVGLAWPGSAEGWKLVTVRALDAFNTHPAPWIHEVLRNSVNAFGIALCAILICGQASLTRTALVLTLLARSGFDKPLPAFYVVCGTLCAAVALIPPHRGGDTQDRSSRQSKRKVLRSR